MKSNFLFLVACLIVMTPAAVAETQNTINISIPETPISMSLPNVFEIYSQEMIDLKFQPGPNQPIWVVGNEDGSVSVTLSINLEDISATPLTTAMNQMKMGLSQHRTDLKWVNNEIRELNGKRWVYLEFKSQAFNAEIHNHMLFSNYGKKMVLLNINATMKEHDKYQDSIQEIIKSITFNECADKVRLMTKAAHNEKKKFDDFWLASGRDFLKENLYDHGDEAQSLYQKAIDSAFSAGKSSWFCNELSDTERHYWAYHHIAATNYLKMSIGLPEEVYQSFKEVSDSLEILEKNTPFRSPQLAVVTDKYSDGTYYSAAHTRISAGIALMALGQYEESKINLIKAGELITKKSYNDIENGIHVLAEVTSSLFALPREVVSYEDAMKFIPFGIDLAIGLFPEKTDYKYAIDKSPYLAELVENYVIGLKGINDYKTAEKWSKLISDSELQESVVTYKCDTLKDLEINSTTGHVVSGESKSLAFKLDKTNKKISLVGLLDSALKFDFQIVDIKKLPSPEDISFKAEDDEGGQIDYYNGKFSYVNNYVGKHDFLATSVLIAKCNKF